MLPIMSGYKHTHIFISFKTKMCFQPAAIVFRLLVLYLMHKGNEATMVPATKHERIIDYDQLRNAVFLKSEDILLAGDRIFHKLGGDLSIIQEPFLCDPSSCENTNKILVVTEDQNKIIICGTRNEGRCEMRSVANLSEVSTSGSLPAVSNQTHIPAVALVTKSNTMIIGYNTTDGGNFVYKITEINLATLVSTNTLLLGSEQKYTETKPLIYFKTALPSILNLNRNYVLIHKKVSWYYTSQMVVVCRSLNITIDISCTHENKNYSLIQDADIFDSGTSAGIVFVGAFVSSDDSQSESGDSVVCIQKLSQLDPGVTSSTCGGVSTAVTLTSSYKLPSSEGYITSIKGDKAPTTNIYVINIGTSMGRFIKTSSTPVGETLQQFAYTVVQEGASVVAIHSHKNGTKTYVVTGKKVALYFSSNCDYYATCLETVSGNNPFCGWCFFKGRSTTKSDCSSGWISMVGSCSSISVSPGSQRVGESQVARLSTTNIPPNGIQTGDAFQCSIMERKTNVIATYNSNMEFTCTIPKIAEHQTTSLELVGTRSGKEFLVGRTEYLIYKCDQFKRCGHCINKRVQCKWCSGICQEIGESCTPTATCPMVSDKEIYVPNGVESDAVFDVAMPTTFTVACYVKKVDATFVGIVNGNTVTCKLKITMESNSATKENVTVLLKYGPTSASAELDNETNVTVYRCDGLTQDCTHCQALNSSRYQCHWDNSTGTCVAGLKTNVQCPIARITKVSPLNSPAGGTTLITINGTDFPNKTPVNVTVAGVSCSPVTTTISRDPDFQEEVIDSLSSTCTSSYSYQESSGPVIVTIGRSKIDYIHMFEYKHPNITDVSPKTGIRSGGTVMTFSGRNLALGNRKIVLRYNNVFPLSNCSVVNSETLTCTLQRRPYNDMSYLRASFDGARIHFQLNFTIIDDPIVINVSSYRSILSGGTEINISGINITNVWSFAVTVLYNGFTQNQVCDKASSTLLQCRFPPAPPNLKRDLDVKLTQHQGRLVDPDSSCKCIQAAIIIKLDGYEKAFTVSYYPDPVFNKFSDVPRLDPNDNYIELIGNHLDVVETVQDIIVTVGLEECSELALTTNSLTCKIPGDLIYGAQYLVVVKVGNVEQNVGYILYGADSGSKLVIIGVVLGLVSLLVIPVAVFGLYQMKKIKRNNMQTKLNFMTMRATRTQSKEKTFLTLMDKVITNRNIPYHCYNRYLLNALFPGNQHDQPRSPKHSADQGLAKLETLILTKEFLVSLVTTLDKEDCFSHTDRSSLASRMCVILLGKMDYIYEVLKVLLNDIVQEAVGARTYATIFEIFETTTEYILRNWMALTIYPQLKKKIGSDLYHLVMATRLTMEDGPVDVITHDAKFSLREDKLLMQWEPFTQQKISAQNAQSCTNQLTLRVIVNEGNQEYECKVLDCDTITQVKTKCLSQIYVNQPATQLGVHPIELILNWHCGGKTLTLKDEDTSSVKHGNLLRLNTLAHYRISDGAKMSLVDPATLNQHDYMEINLEFPVLTYNPMHGDNTSINTSKWHLVKPMADLDMTRKASTMKDQNKDNISLTKRTIDKYLTTFFDHILDRAHCPPPATFIFDYIDFLANKFKIDKDTAWLWKSRIYTVHVWGPMIRKPNQLFDMYLPQYVVDNLDVIAQLLEDGTAESAPTLSEPKIYENEMTKYKTKAKAFINNQYDYNEQPNVLAEYLEDVNKIQLGQRLNKMGYLQKIFDQLIPHLDQIVTDLSADSACSNLELDRKMQEVIVMLK